jgi:cytochrome c oxidase assembly protein subunit 15
MVVPDTYEPPVTSERASRRRWLTLTPAAYRWITAGALVSLAIIIVTGAAVRLTGSGLGCPDWPNCTDTQFVSAQTGHAAIEQANRLFTGAVSVAVMLAVLGSMFRSPRRSDLARWSWGLVAGVLGQIVLGGLVVLFELSPWLVIGHFLMSIVLVWNATVLHHRAGHDGSPQRPIVAPAIVWVGRALVGVTLLVVFTGTLVTGSGPHGGNENVERLALLVHTAARIHGTVVMVLVALVATAAILQRRHGALRSSRRALGIVGAVLVAQATVGYVQYFTGVPVGLVALHVVGATVLWISVLHLYLGLFASVTTTPAPIPSPTTTPRVSR